MRKVDLAQYLATLRTRLGPTSEQSVYAGLAPGVSQPTPCLHLVVARRDEQAEVLVELPVCLAYWADIRLGLASVKILKHSTHTKLDHLVTGILHASDVQIAIIIPLRARHDVAR